MTSTSKTAPGQKNKMKKIHENGLLGIELSYTADKSYYCSTQMGTNNWQKKKIDPCSPNNLIFHFHKNKNHLPSHLLE